MRRGLRPDSAPSARAWPARSWRRWRPPCSRTRTSVPADLVQVVLDGAGTDEQLGADLTIRAPVPGKLGDLPLLGRQLSPRVVRPLPYLLAGGLQLTFGARGEGARPHRGEQLARGPELLARVDPPVLAPEPLAVEQVGTAKMRHDAGPSEPLDRRTEFLVRDLAFADQGPAAGLQAEPPVGGGRTGRVAEPGNRRRRDARLPGAGGRVVALGEATHGPAHVRGGGAAPPALRERL